MKTVQITKMMKMIKLDITIEVIYHFVSINSLLSELLVKNKHSKIRLTVRENKFSNMNLKGKSIVDVLMT